MTDALYEYVVDTFASEERALLATMAKPAAEAGMPLIMIAEDQARFLRVLLPAVGAKSALDVGTLFGYSAYMMAKTMGRGAHVVSLELSPVHAEVARKNLERLGVAKDVDIQVGPALEQMRRLPSRSFDFVLIDADKGGYIDYFTEALRLVRRGGLIAADNALAWAHPQVEACLLPLGDGLVVARVKN
jgi:predicted O-methyltransferase YrrM